MKALAVLAVALLCGTAHAVTLSWRNPLWQPMPDTAIHVRETLDSAFVFTSRWDDCSPVCGGEKLLAVLSVRGREGMSERLVIARPPGVYSYRIRTTDLARNRSWPSNEAVYDERPASLARTAIEPEAWINPAPLNVKKRKPWWRVWP